MTALAPIARSGLSRLAALCLGLALALAAPAARALEPEEAKSFVQETTDEMLELVRSDASASEKADRFEALMERRGAMPQIAKFAAGRIWREMDEGQRDAFADAFAHWLAVTYSRRFQEYSGQTIEIVETRDAGNRGIEVVTRVVGGGQAPVRVVWLVSDRPGRTVLADLVIEGVSMLITQREEVSAIYAREGGVDGLIERMEAAERSS
ncbi:MAG: phospholipid-binding protein MlaC [Paracoccaceae bacterium]